MFQNERNIVFCFSIGKMKANIIAEFFPTYQIFPFEVSWFRCRLSNFKSKILICWKDSAIMLVFVLYIKENKSHENCMIFASFYAPKHFLKNETIFFI